MSTVPTPTEPSAAEANLAEAEAEDIGFGKAILVGSAIGILVMVFLVAVALRLLDPEMAWGATIGISVWTGIWAGLFLGGTITVGKWAGERH